MLWSFLVHAVNQLSRQRVPAVFGAPISAGSECANGASAARRILIELDARAVDVGLPATSVRIIAPIMTRGRSDPVELFRLA